MRLWGLKEKKYLENKVREWKLNEGREDADLVDERIPSYFTRRAKPHERVFCSQKTPIDATPLFSIFFSLLCLPYVPVIKCDLARFMQYCKGTHRPGTCTAATVREKDVYIFVSKEIKQARWASSAMTRGEKISMDLLLLILPTGAVYSTVYTSVESLKKYQYCICAVS